MDSINLLTSSIVVTANYSIGNLMLIYCFAYFLLPLNLDIRVLIYSVSILACRERKMNWCSCTVYSRKLYAPPVVFSPSVFNTIKLTFTQRDHKSMVTRLFPKHLEVQSGKLFILITAFLLQDVLLQCCPSSLEIPAVIYPVCRVLPTCSESVFS